VVAGGSRPKRDCGRCCAREYGTSGLGRRALQARLCSEHNRKRYASGGVGALRCTWCGVVFDAHMGLVVGAARRIWGSPGAPGGRTSASDRPTCGISDAVAGALAARQARRWDSGAHFVRAGAVGAHVFGAQLAAAQRGAGGGPGCAGGRAIPPTPVDWEGLLFVARGDAVHE
jgi:hypothetical protein